MLNLIKMIISIALGGIPIIISKIKKKGNVKMNEIEETIKAMSNDKIKATIQELKEQIDALINEMYSRTTQSRDTLQYQLDYKAKYLKLIENIRGEIENA